jgi:hypothetical protein
VWAEALREWLPSPPAVWTPASRKEAAEGPPGGYASYLPPSAAAASAASAAPPPAAAGGAAGQPLAAVVTFDLAQHLAEPSRRFGFLIVDEAHKLKTPTAAQTRALGAMARAAQRCVLLTGALRSAPPSASSACGLRRRSGSRSGARAPPGAAPGQR